MLVLRDESLLGGGHTQRRARDQAALPHMQWDWDRKLDQNLGVRPHCSRATLEAE